MSGDEGVHAGESGAPMGLVARVLLYAHALLAMVSVLLLIAFLPSLGAPRVPILYGLLYSSIRWLLFELHFYAVPALFVFLVFAFTGATRWSLNEAMLGSPWYTRTLLWSWVAMLAAWLLILAVAMAGVA